MNTKIRTEIPLQERLANAEKNRYSELRCTFKNFEILRTMSLEDYFAHSPSSYENINDYFPLTPDLTYRDLANKIYQMHSNIDASIDTDAEDNCVNKESIFQVIMDNFIAPFNDYFNFWLAEKSTKDLFNLDDDDENADEPEELQMKINGFEPQKHISKISLEERTKRLTSESLTLLEIAGITVHNYLHGISEYIHNPKYKEIQMITGDLDADRTSLMHYINCLSNRYENLPDIEFASKLYNHLFILLVIPFSKGTI